MKPYFAIFLCIVALVIPGCGAAATTPTPPPRPTRIESPTTQPPVELQVIPKKLRPGMRAVILGVGFERGERVAFYLIRPDGTRTSEAESTADTSGGAAIQLDVMDDWQPGQYIAHVQSEKNPARRAEQKIELGRR